MYKNYNGGREMNPVEGTHEDLEVLSEVAKELHIIRFSLTVWIEISKSCLSCSEGHSCEMSEQ